MTPGSRPSSSAASELISETIRYGPQIISTWAITVSFLTFVTIPLSRLRALTAEARVPVPVGVLGQRLGQRGEVGAGDDGAAVLGCAVATRPASTQRRSGVVADAEQLGRLRNSVGRHAAIMPQLRLIVPAIARRCEVRVRSRGRGR